MTELPDDERIEQRARLLPEEASEGSDDPQAQAEAMDFLTGLGG